MHVLKPKIALIQTHCTENPKDNLYRQMGLIREAAQQGANIVCLQELFNTLYFCVDYNEDYFKWAESLDGELVQSLCELAKELEVVIIAPFFEKEPRESIITRWWLLMLMEACWGVTEKRIFRMTPVSMKNIISLPEMRIQALKYLKPNMELLVP